MIAIIMIIIMIIIQVLMLIMIMIQVLMLIMIMHNEVAHRGGASLRRQPMAWHHIVALHGLP